MEIAGVIPAVLCYVMYVQPLLSGLKSTLKATQLEVENDIRRASAGFITT